MSFKTGKGKKMFSQKIEHLENYPKGYVYSFKPVKETF